MTTIVLDGTYLCHRAFHSTGSLSHEGKPTGVTFGFLKSLQVFNGLFRPENVVICFDHGKGVREEKYVWYKESRRKKVYTDDEEYLRDNMRIEVKHLKESLLTDLGYNVFYQTGYEADDLIASVVQNEIKGTDRDTKFIVITGDHDMYQLIHRQVSVFHPASNVQSGSHINKDIFESMFGVKSRQWVEVKAIAGCKTDDVPGVKGVGETLAAEFVSGKMNKKTETYKKITKFIESKQYRINQKVVRLPYPGTKTFRVERMELNTDKWDEVCGSMGMDSLTSHVPVINIRRRGKDSRGRMYR